MRCSRDEGRFDKISSVGMFEAIGASHFATYFKTLRRLLKPGGLYLHHAITRPGKRGATSAAKTARQETCRNSRR